MKFLKITGIVTIVVITLAVFGVTLSFAQQPDPFDGPWWNTMRSMMQGRSGMMGGNWGSMQQMHNQMSQNGGMNAMHAWMHQSGGVHDSVWAALAEQLGLTSDELNNEINEDKTLAQIAEEKGVSTQDLAATMENGMKTGLAQEVKDGVLTQEQANQMLKNMEGQYEWMLTHMDAGMMGTGGSVTAPGGRCHDNY